MDESEPGALQGGALTIAVKIRLALKDQQWHELPAVVDRVEGYPAAEVEAVFARMVANGQIEEDDTVPLTRYRVASRTR